jgi:hypothetical protein
MELAVNDAMVQVAAAPAALAPALAAEAKVLADFLAATRDNEQADIAFKKRRGILGLGVALFLGLVSWRFLPQEVKLVTEAGSGMLALFMGSPLIVGVRSNLDRIHAYEALRQLLMTPGADATAIEEAREFLKKTLGGGA